MHASFLTIKRGGDWHSETAKTTGYIKMSRCIDATCAKRRVEASRRIHMSKRGREKRRERKIGEKIVKTVAEVGLLPSRDFFPPKISIEITRSTEFDTRTRMEQDDF